MVAGDSAGGCCGWIRSRRSPQGAGRGLGPRGSRARWGFRAIRCGATVEGGAGRHAQGGGAGGAGRWRRVVRGWRRCWRVAALDGWQAAADRRAAAPMLVGGGPRGRRHRRQGDRSAEWKRQRQEVFVPLVYKPGRPRRGRLLRGARRRRRRAAQGVDVRDAADALGPRLRVALPAAGSGRASSTGTCARSSTSARCRIGSSTTISRRRCARSSSAASASWRRGSWRSRRTTCSSRASPVRVGPRQGRRRVARQGDPLAGAGADSHRAGPRDDQRRAAGAARRARGRERDAEGRSIVERFDDERAGCCRCRLGLRPAASRRVGVASQPRQGRGRRRTRCWSSGRGSTSRSTPASTRSDRRWRRPRRRASAAALRRTLGRLPALPAASSRASRRRSARSPTS